MPAPPGPKGGFFSAAASAFRRDQLGFYESSARDYGDVVATRMGPYRIWLVYHPDAITAICCRCCWPHKMRTTPRLPRRRTSLGAGVAR